ncbi:MAG: lamin tail domain-containing protein, partial [Verrucomicrobiales bacterium]|nr:lamin tail domain-containing protein [Verrucomicrobiales bacterium]
MHRLVRLAAWALACSLVATPAATAAASFAISEFLASNSSSVTDDNGDREDWIELRNTTAQVQSLGGWTLTDDALTPAKWTCPATNIPPGGFLLIFASGKDRARAGAVLHTNFRLSDAGEYLGLFPPGTETAATEFAPEFPPQEANVSFGRNADGELRFFNPPTPGAANGVGFASRVADTRFNVDRGFHDAPFDLVLSTETPGAEIRYSTNGTAPTATSGLVYSAPLRIAGTTHVRAAAFRAGWLPSNVDTHTYLFAKDIPTQSANGSPPPGWPSSWGSNTRDYGMDPDVVNDPRYRNTLVDDLKSLPSFCVTVHLPDLFEPSRGIYANPGQDGRAWERPMSLELVYPDGRDGFQIDGGIRIRGGFSRSTDNPKHAFRFFFRQEYGAGRLRFPLFGDGGTDDFDGFDLRTFQNYSWSFQGDSRGTFMRDQFNRDAQLAMGSQGERGDYYHLYINGQYWGVYNTCERPEASYGATYFGGNAEDYDVIKVEAGPYTINATDGTMAGWTELYNLVRSGMDDTKYRRLLGLNPDGTRNPAYPVYIDPVNLIDYMLVILYGGNLDAPISNFLGNTSPNNFFGMWNRVTRDRGFQFFVHDAEHTLLDVNSDRTGPFPAGNDSVTKSNPQWLWQRLLAAPEFKILAGDRVHRHLQNGGVLTPERARELYQRRRTQIDRAVVAESARWGDSKRAADPFTRDDDWIPAVAGNLDFINRRAAILLAQLRADGVYPALAAPQFNQHGGVVNPGFGLLMAGSGKPVYFTLDGSDPRAPGGAIAAAARIYAQPLSLTESLSVKARTYDNGTWSALADAEFTLAQTYTELFVTEIHYHPQGTADRDGDDFEFIELKNVGRQTLDLSGVQFTNGLSYRFPNGTRLAPGAFAVLVRDPVAFASRYPGRAVAGTFQGRLSNSGERVTLVHASGAPLFEVTYDTRPPWPQAADGQGFSLVPVQPSTNADPNSPASWRASSAVGGSPGADDTAPSIAPVVINEVLAHTDPPLVDGVELHNPQDVPAAIGGWWLSDDRSRPNKFRIPAGTVIPPHGFISFSELNFNRPTNAPTSFNFSSHGDEAWVFSADATGALTGYSDGIAFDASANGVSFGRHTNSVGKIGFPPQLATSLDLPNTGPRLGPVILNELHYDASAGGVEFIELRNISPDPVPLFDPLVPTNTWRVEGIGYALPTGLVLPPGGLLVVAATEPARFRAAYGLPETVPVVGPFAGSLSDSGETVTLQRPDSPDLLPDGTILVP